MLTFNLLEHDWHDCRVRGRGWSHDEGKGAVDRSWGVCLPVAVVDEPELPFGLLDIVHAKAVYNDVRFLPGC